MSEKQNGTNDEVAIRDLVEDWAGAVRVGRTFPRQVAPVAARQRMAVKLNYLIRF